MLFWFVSAMMAEMYFFDKKRKHFPPNLLPNFLLYVVSGLFKRE